MIRLSLEVYSTPISLPEEIVESFSDPVLFYLFYEQDQRKFFPVFSVVDYANKRIIYFDSFLEENKIIIESSPYQEAFKAFSWWVIHGIVEHGDDIFIFNEFASFFYKLNIKNTSLEIWTIADLLGEDYRKNHVFCSTVSVLDDTSFVIGISNMIHNKEEWYKLSFDCAHIEKIFSDSSLGFIHTILPYKGILYGSLFFDTKIKKRGDSKEFTQAEWYKYVFKDFFQKYCLEYGLENSEQSFSQAVQISDMYTLSPDFTYFLESRYGTSSFLKLCLQNEIYAFEAAEGEFIAYNMRNNTLSRYKTTKPSPAHFALDSENDILYVSNHNFFRDNFHVFMLGTAVIDKFQIDGDELKKLGSFQHEGAYRFASHILFSVNNKKYIVTTGQPNRLFFIDAETMELEHFVTIGDDILAQQPDLKWFMENTSLQAEKTYDVLTCIQVSKTNGIVFLLGTEYIYFYSFLHKKIIIEVPYQSALKAIDKYGLRRLCVHCYSISQNILKTIEEII